MKKFFLLLSKVLLTLFLIFLTLSVLCYGLGSYYKKELLAYFNTSLSEKISGDLHFNDLRISIFHPFPSFSVALEGFSVKDSVYKQDVLRAEKVFLQLKLYPLLRKELRINSIQIQDAVFAMMKDSNGYSNLNAFRLKNPKPKDSISSTDDKGNSLEFALKKATLKNVAFDFRDEKKNKSINLVGERLEISLHKAEELYKLHLKGKVHSGGLNFNAAKGAFLDNKDFDLNLLIDYDLTHKFMTILPHSSVSADGQQYDVQGRSDLGQKPPVIKLEIACADTDYDKALSLLNTFLRSKLQKFHAAGNLSSYTILYIDTRPGTEPKVWVNFDLKDSKARLKDFEFEHVFLKGLFTNCADTSLPASNENSKVELNGEHLSYQGIDCQFKGLLNNLKEVDATIQASAKGPLNTFNYFLDTTKCLLPSGNLNLDLTYKGPLDLKKSENQKLNASVNGHLKIENGHLKMVGKQMDFDKINTNIVFDNQDVKIGNISTSFNGNLLSVKGNIKHLLPFLLFPDSDCAAELSLYSPYFNVNSLVSNKKKGTKKQSSKKSKPIMKHLENIGDHLSMTLNLAADRIQYRKMNATQVKGLITLDDKALSISNLQLQLPPKGNIHLKGKYYFIADRPNHMELTVGLKDIDATQIFKDFDDFHQKALSYKQLGGRMNGDLSVVCDVDENQFPEQSTLKGYAKLKFVDGSINNFEPLKNISKVIFKERDLMHIRFDDINTKFIVDGYDINIETLNVNSSAISLFVEGTYSFKNNTDLGIQIPLSNLKARKEEFYHAEQHSHGNIRLRARDKDGKVSVSFDQFDKFHKERRIN